MKLASKFLLVLNGVALVAALVMQWWWLAVFFMVAMFAIPEYDPPHEPPPLSNKDDMP